MSTPDQRDPRTESTDAADEFGATTAGGGSGSHSAPRPVPPIGESSSDTVVVDSRGEPGSTGSPNPPQRVSAFPAFDRGTAQSSTGTPDGVASSGADVTSAAAATSALPQTPASSRWGAGSDAFSGSSASAEPTTALPAATPVTAAVGPAEPVETARTRVVPAGSSVPLADEESLAGSTAGRLKSEQRTAFPDSEWEERPAKRTAAHLWGILATLILVPIAWFLLADGALRTFYSLQEVGDSPNIAGLLSLAGGIIALIVLALVARASSLGAWIWGAVVAVGGITYLAIPSTVMQWQLDHRETFLSIHEGFGTNVYNYLLDSGRSGLLLVFGVVLLLFAIVSHASRRSGRTEGRIKAEAAARGDV